MNPEQNKQIIKEAYAAFSRGDLTSVLALLSENVVWRMPGTLPHSGTYRGPRGVADYFRKFVAETEIISFEPREFVTEGDRTRLRSRQSKGHRAHL